MNQQKMDLFDFIKSLSIENSSEDPNNYLIFDSDINYNLELLADLLKNNSNLNFLKADDRSNKTYFMRNNLHFIVETSDLKDIPPHILNCFGKIYLGNEMISLQETVEYESIKIHESFKDCKFLQQKKFGDFLFKKFIKLIINSSVFDQFLEKKRITIQYLRFLPNFMKKFQEYEMKFMIKENLNIIEKYEFICSVSLIEILHINFAYASAKNSCYDIDSSIKNLMISLMKSFPFNTLLKKCFDGIKDKKISDFYFDFDEMKYVSFQSNSSVDKFLNLNNNRTIFLMSKNVFKLKNLSSFLLENEGNQKIFLFGEEGSGKSCFLDFFSKYLKLKNTKMFQLNETTLYKKISNHYIFFFEFSIET